MVWLRVKKKPNIYLNVTAVFSSVKFKFTYRRKTHWLHKTVFQTKLFTAGIFDVMTHYEYVKCYRRQQFLILSTNSVSPQRIEATY